jgi:hypothetical protein
LRAGFFKGKFRCNDCTRNPGNKETWGCHGRIKGRQPIAKEDEDGIRYNYFSCPVRFIPASLTSFISLLDFYRDFPSAKMPDFDNVSMRFFMAYRYYNAKLKETLESMEKQ